MSNHIVKERALGMRASDIAAVLLSTGVFRYLGILKGWGMLPVSLLFGLGLIAPGAVLDFTTLRQPSGETEVLA